MRTLLTIWTQPRKTFEFLDNNEGIDSEVNLDVLYYLGSLAFMIPAIPTFVSKYETKGEPAALVIIMALIGVIMVEEIKLYSLISFFIFVSILLIH